MAIIGYLGGDPVEGSPVINNDPNVAAGQGNNGYTASSYAGAGPVYGISDTPGASFSWSSLNYSNSNQPWAYRLARFVSKPLLSQTLTGTITTNQMTRAAYATNMHPVSLLRIIGPTGTVKYRSWVYGNGHTTGWTLKSLDHTLSNVSVADGDRLVVEIGTRVTSTNTSLGWGSHVTDSADAEYASVEASMAVLFETADFDGGHNSTPATAAASLPAPTVDPNAPVHRTVSAGAMTATAAMPAPQVKISGPKTVEFSELTRASADRGSAENTVSATTLAVGGSVGSGVFVKFGPMVAGGASAAKLRFYLQSSVDSNHTIFARRITTPWSETSGTVSPTAEFAAEGTWLQMSPNSPQGWYEIDVKPIIDAWAAGQPNYGIVLTRTGNNTNHLGASPTIRSIEYVGDFEVRVETTGVYTENLQNSSPATATGSMLAPMVHQMAPMEATAELVAPDVEAEWPIWDAEINADAALGDAVLLDPTAEAVHDPNFSHNAEVFTVEASMPNPLVIGETPVSVTISDTLDGSAEMLPATYSNKTDRTLEAGVMWATGRLPALFDPWPRFLSRLVVTNRFALNEYEGAVQADNSVNGIDNATGARVAIGSPPSGEIVGDVETGLDVELYNRRFYRFHGNGRVDFPVPMGGWRQTSQGTTGPVTTWVTASPATVMVFRTSQADANMTNALKLRNGRLYYDGTDTRWFEPGQQRTITDFHRFGSRRYDDGEWHVFTEVRRPSVSIVNPTPASGMITVQTQARLWFVDGVLDTVRTGTMPSFDFRRIGGDGFVGDIAELTLLGALQESFGLDNASADTGFFTETAKHIYNAWFDYNPVFAKPLEGSGEMRSARGKGNRIRAIGFYPTDGTIVSDQFMTNAYLPNITDWDRNWTPVMFPTDTEISRLDWGETFGRVLNAQQGARYGYENGQALTGRYGDVRVETKRVFGYLDWITGQRNDVVKFDNPNEWDEPGSYVDLAKYDAIFIVAGPRQGTPAGRREWRERFVRPLMRKAAELELPIIIHDPRVAEDFGVASRHEMFDANFEMYFDHYAAYEIDLPTLPAGLIARENSSAMPDNNFLNRARVASELPGLTDIVDEGRMDSHNVWAFALKQGLTMNPNFGYKVVRDRAWNVGDELRFAWGQKPISHVSEFTSGGMKFGQNFFRKIAMAYQHLGQPILRGPRSIWTGTQEMEVIPAVEGGQHRIADGTLSFIVHAGTDVNGITLGAPIFVDYTRSRPSTTGVSGVRVNNEGPDGTPNVVVAPDWDYIDQPRNRYSTEQVFEWETRRSEGSGHGEGAHSGGQNWQEYSKILISQITSWGGISFRTPFRVLDRYSLGDRWLRYLKLWQEEMSGDSKNFTNTARATAEMPKPLVTADHPGGFTAAPMRATGIMRTPRNLPTITVNVLPMVGSGMMGGIRKGSQPGPMVATGSLVMPPVVFAEGLGVPVYMYQEPIEVYLTQ